MALIIILGFILLVLFFVYSHRAVKRNFLDNSPEPLNQYPEYEFNEFDKKLIWLINEYRNSLNLPSLKANKKLSDVSYSHSLYMANQQKVSHDFAVNRQAEYPDKKLGEILAHNYIYPEGMLEGWKNSLKHNEVLLSIEYNFIGLSTVEDEFGKNYCCCLLLE